MVAHHKWEGREVELQQAIEAYFKTDPEKPVLSDLALALGYCDRIELVRAGERDNEQATHIKKAITRIEGLHEKRMYGQCPAGSIFWLKNRKWSDRQEVSHSIDTETSSLLSVLAGSKGQLPDEQERTDK